MSATLSPLFTAAQREQFTRFPQIDERILSRHYLLDGADLLLVRERRRDFNKLGFAVQLTVLRHLGRALRPGETPPGEVLAFLAEQLRVKPACYPQYAAREPTRREHFAALCQRLGYSELSRHQGAELRDWLVPLAVVTDQPFPLMSALMDELRRHHLLVPRFSVLERLVRSARVRADQHAYSLLNLPIKWKYRGFAYLRKRLDNQSEVGCGRAQEVHQGVQAGGRPARQRAGPERAPGRAGSGDQRLSAPPLDA